MFVKRDYYTLKDLVEKCNTGSIDIEYLLGQNVTDGFTHILCTVFGITATYLGTELKSTEANTLWCRYIVPYFLNDVIAFRDNGEPIGDNESNAEEFQDWITKYCAIFNRTYFRYKKLIDDFEAAKATLMDDISQSTTTRFNDTPQNGGDFSSDSYTTNYTKSETKTPITTKMARLEEIRLGWDNLYRTWADEFGGLFIDSAEMK